MICSRNQCYGQIYSVFSQKSFDILLNIIPYTEIKVDWVGKKCCTLKEAEAGN